MPSFSKTLLTALLFSSVALALPTPQLHGEGAAADSILTDTDNGVGYGVENAENNVANTIKPGSAPSGNSASGGGSSSAPPPPPPQRRQADKISKGAQNIGNALGVGASTAPATDAGESIDGTLTDGASNAGATIGSTEASTLESGGEAVPRKL